MIAPVPPPQVPRSNRTLALPVLRPWAVVIYAVCLALILPSLPLGRAPMPILLGLGIAAIVALYPLPTDTKSLWRTFWRMLRRRAGRPVTIAALVALAAFVLSLPGSINPNASWTIWLQVAGVALLGAIAAYGLGRDEFGFSLSLKVLIGGTLAALLFGLVAYYLYPPILEIIRDRPSQTAQEAGRVLKPFATILPLATPVCVWAGIKLGGWWRAAGFLCLSLAILFTLLAASYSAQGGWLAAVAAVAGVWLLVKLPRAVAWASGIALTLLVIAAGAVVVQTVPRPPQKPPQDLTVPTSLVDEHRQYIWGFVLHHAERRPVFGMGLEGTRKLPGSSEIIASGLQQYVPSHPHNWAVQIYAETGAVGLLATLGWLFMIGRWLVRQAARRRAPAYAGAAVCGAFLFMSLYSFSIWAAWWQISFFLMLAYVSAGLSLAERAGPE